MPLITWKRMATGILLSAAILFLCAGIVLQNNACIVIGGATLLIVVGLVVIATYRRVGYTMQLIADQQRTLLTAQERIEGISHKVSKIDDSLRRAAVGDLGSLILSTYRDVSEQLNRSAEEVSQRDTELRQRLGKVESLSSAIEASTSALGKTLDHHRTLHGQLSNSLQEDVKNHFGEINGYFEKQSSEHRGYLDQIRESLKNVTQIVGSVPSSDDMEEISTNLIRLGDSIIQRLDESDGRFGKQLAEYSSSFEEIRVSLGNVECNVEKTSRSDEFQTLSDSVLQERERLVQSLNDLGERSAKAVSEEWKALEKTVVTPLKQLSREIGAGHLRFDILNDIWSMHNLHETVRPGTIAPQMTAWSLEPASLARLFHIVLERKPKLIVECGSGASTVWLAYAAREVGAKVVALEHLEKYAAATSEEIKRHGLSEHVQVRFAPLETFDVEGEKFSWYSRDTWKELVDIDLLLVDGPPKATGDHARYPAVPLLRPGIGLEALIVLDDVHRQEEQEVLTRWRKQFGAMGAEHSIGPRTVAVEWKVTDRS